MDLDRKILNSEDKASLSRISRGLHNLACHFNQVKSIYARHQETEYVKLSKADLYEGKLPYGLYTFVSEYDYENGNLELRKTLAIKSVQGRLVIELDGRADSPKQDFFTAPLSIIGSDVIYVPVSEYYSAVLSEKDC